MSNRHRATQLDVDEVRRLDHFAALLSFMFPGSIGVALVGSSLTEPDYRDVDVRIILADDHYDQLARILDVIDLNTLLSGWGKQVTELRIDCQVQSFAEHNKHHDSLRGDGRRTANFRPRTRPLPAGGRHMTTRQQGDRCE